MGSSVKKNLQTNKIVCDNKLYDKYFVIGYNKNSHNHVS